jgi:ribosomal protein L16/L10AE
MAKKKRITKKDLDAIERAVKREAQKEAGALDGRFRVKVVPDKKRKAQRKRDKGIDPEEL